MRSPVASKSEADDLDRLRREYAQREQRFAGSDIYSPFNQANLFKLQQRQRATLSALRSQGVTGLAQKRILEVGCGRGVVLLEYLGCGAVASGLFGVDLLFDRLQEAAIVLPGLPLAGADGQHLPYPAATFDLVSQYMAFSSILNDQVKANLAQEMLRVLKPGGIVVWYDFWLNPTNPQTRGILPDEIRRLFPGCDYHFTKTTLAPPLARRIVPFSWAMALLLESLKLFNSHYLALIRPRRDSDAERR
jgi:ubiquinone/menaquinone biosynthesis C-methylase UbiE